MSKKYVRKKLKLLRVDNNYNQEEMAERLGVTRTTYHNIETGKTNGSGNFWVKLKKEFPDIDIEEMAEREAI